LKKRNKKNTDEVLGLEDLRVVIGLGNPEDKYRNTRHNIGFEVINYLSIKHDINITKLKHKALIGDGYIGDSRVLLVKPQTFMNNSGECVEDILNWYKIPTENIILIYDDIDLDVGKIRIRPRGSAGTHNGMRSVLYHVRTEEIPRIRIGIGKPPEGWPLAEYVLGRFTPQEIDIMKNCIVTAADAVECIIKYDIEKAMNSYNK